MSLRRRRYARLLAWNLSDGSSAPFLRAVSWHGRCAEVSKVVRLGLSLHTPSSLFAAALLSSGGTRL
eukprot:6087862-Lingulodinium_polyedra.AAC.1